MFDDQVRTVRTTITIGETLSALSIVDLQERIAALSEEIDRVKATLASKQAATAAAEAFFSKS